MFYARKERKVFWFDIPLSVRSQPVGWLAGLTVGLGLGFAVRLFLGAYLSFPSLSEVVDRLPYSCTFYEVVVSRVEHAMNAMDSVRSISRFD